MASHQGRAVGAREAAVWMLGVCCGVGAMAAGDAALLPCGAVIALAGAAPVVTVALWKLLRLRRRAVVWEESGWRPAADGPACSRPPAGAAGLLTANPAAKPFRSAARRQDGAGVTHPGHDKATRSPNANVTLTQKRRHAATLPAIVACVLRPPN